MNERDYTPYILERVEKVRKDYFRLDIRPQRDFNFDCYYEIHIESDEIGLETFKTRIYQYIFIELVSEDLLEIWDGEFYYERSSDGMLSYKKFEYKVFEKLFTSEWRPKFFELQEKFKSEFKRRLPDYESTRSAVITKYHEIYVSEINSNSAFKQFLHNSDKRQLFNSIYGLFKFNPVWDGLNKMIDPEYMNRSNPKDWKLAYLELESMYMKLLSFDTSNYELIRDQMLELYKKSFYYQLNNMKYHNSDVDVRAYSTYFELLMEKLGLT